MTESTAWLLMADIVRGIHKKRNLEACALRLLASDVSPRTPQSPALAYSDAAIQDSIESHRNREEHAEPPEAQRHRVVLTLNRQWKPGDREDPSPTRMPAPWSGMPEGPPPDARGRRLSTSFSRPATSFETTRSCGSRQTALLPCLWVIERHDSVLPARGERCRLDAHALAVDAERLVEA
jgi:hypothetical protein